MLMGPNQAYIDYLLSQSVFYYDPFYSGSWSGTPANNDPIGTFNDRYGRATWQLTQPSGTSQPLYQSNSGKPYLLYDGVDDVLLTASINSTTDFSGQKVTILQTLNDTSSGVTNVNAVKYVGATSPTRLIGVQMNNQIPTWQAGGATNCSSTYNSFKVFGGVKATGTGTRIAYTNGKAESTGNGVDITNGSDNMFVGAFRNSAVYGAFTGWMGEYVGWNTALTAYDVNLLSRYFMARRGLTA